MTMNEGLPILSIELDNADLIIEALDRVPYEVKKNWSKAGREASAEILDTEGLRDYPLAPPNNAPPRPGYLRGVGYQYADGRSKNNSERYGSRFSTRTQGYTSTVIGNTASYAAFLGGSKEDGKSQTKAAAKVGWRKLKDVADEKIKEINVIYNKWMKRAIRKAGLDVD